MQKSTRQITISGIAILRPIIRFRLAGFAFDVVTGVVNVDSMGIIFGLSPLSNLACETEKLEFS